MLKINSEADMAKPAEKPKNKIAPCTREFRYAWFNHGKLTRSIQKDNGDESSVEYQKLLMLIYYLDTYEL